MIWSRHDRCFDGFETQKLPGQCLRSMVIIYSIVLPPISSGVVRSDAVSLKNCYSGGQMLCARGGPANLKTSHVVSLTGELALNEST